MSARVGPRSLFWWSLSWLAFTYVGFPLLVLTRGALRARPHAAAPAPLPTVSVLVAAHDEAAALPAKLTNLLGLDYDPDRLQVVVASDGSTDGTAQVARAHPDPRVCVLDLPRVGKAEALNRAMAAATGEVLVFTDANSAFAPGALRALVAPLADPQVGGVAGDQRYRPGTAGDGTSAGERGYWDLDRRLKRAESAAGNAISATGAIYAVRRELAGPVPAGVTDDFWVSTGVIARGRRLVFAPEAVAWEPVAARRDVEFGRKVRVMTRGLRGVALRRELLDPRRHGFYALQLLSHKVLRRLMVFPLLVLAAVTPALRHQGPVYRALLVVEAAGAVASAVGLALPRTRVGRSRAVAFPAYFVLVQAAALRAVWNLMTGRRIDRWEPRR